MQTPSAPSTSSTTSNALEKLPARQDVEMADNPEISPYEDSTDQEGSTDDEARMDTDAKSPPGFKNNRADRERTRQELRRNKLLPLMKADRPDEDKLNDIEDLLETMTKERVASALKKDEKRVKKLEQFKEKAQTRFINRVDKECGPNRPMNIRETWKAPQKGTPQAKEEAWVKIKGDGRDIATQVEMTPVATLRLSEKIRREPYPSGKGIGTGRKAILVRWEDMGKKEQRQWRKRRAKVGQEIEENMNLEALREERRMAQEEQPDATPAEKNRTRSIDSGYSATPPTKKATLNEEKQELKRRKQLAEPNVRRIDKQRQKMGEQTQPGPTTSTPKPSSSKEKQPETAETPGSPEPQPLDSRPQEPAFEIFPQMADLVTIDHWEQAWNEKEDKKIAERRKEDARKEEERRNSDRKEKEQRKKVRDWKKREDENARRRERGRREEYKEQQRQHYKPNRNFSWNASTNNNYRSDVPAVRAHFGEFRLTREPRPSAWDRPAWENNQRHGRKEFKKHWDYRTTPKSLVRIESHYEDITDDSDIEGTDPVKKRNPNTNTTSTTLDDDDRDPRRKGNKNDAE